MQSLICICYEIGAQHYKRYQVGRQHVPLAFEDICVLGCYLMPWNLATGLTSVGGVQKTKLFYQINFKAKHRDKRFRKDGMQGIKVPKHQAYVELSVLVSAWRAATYSSVAYLRGVSSSSSLGREEPREKRALDLRRSGETLTEKGIRLAGCGCCRAERRVDRRR